MRIKIKDILTAEDSSALIGKTVRICGWVRTVRQQKNFSFCEINDGSSFSGLQVIINSDLPHYEKTLFELTTGSSASITGELTKSPGKGQNLELQAKQAQVYGSADPAKYVLQKKRHSFEFLRTIAHLRPRTNIQGAVIRVRNALAFASHLFFQEKGFYYIHTPIITGSDCEGGGELFRVTTLDAKEMNAKKDFFGKPTYLTVSGQLNVEAFACAMSDVYTFGPTFRAENSNTSRHLAEFWMLEPELAFADLEDCAANAENYLKYVTKYVLNHCEEDLQFFDKFIEKGLLQRLKNLTENTFAKITYTEAVAILEKAKKKFEFPVEWGADLQSEHERYLAEEHCKKPVIITDYPQKLKAFYMRNNEDGKTVAALDILVPKIGELVGGSQREERLDLLTQKIDQMGLNREDYWWYLELREYGTVPHSGYGVGFERLVQFITGMENIRDVIPFPRYPGHADF